VGSGIGSPDYQLLALDVFASDHRIHGFDGDVEQFFILPGRNLFVPSIGFYAFAKLLATTLGNG
jgi:hypothetical protein